jgi:hypothetical protein
MASIKPLERTSVDLQTGTGQVVIDCVTMVSCNCHRNSEAGGSLASKYWPGRVSGKPYSISAEDMAVSS